MPDATDVTSETADGYEERQSFLPPPTFPAAMLMDDDPGGDGGGIGTAAPAAPVAPPADERPARSGLLIRLGHLFCGRPNGLR